MMRFLRSAMVCGVGTGLFLTVLAHPAHGCARVMEPGADVQVTDEEAVIVWDAAAHRERFIRHANFRTNTENFGFLVPTPTKPTLREAPQGAFSLLGELIKPQVIEKHERTYVPASLFSLFDAQKLRGGEDAAVASHSAMLSTGVEVLQSEKVGRYDAVVLAADSAGALKDWLKTHGYVANPALLEWLQPYILAHWKITAFKISKETYESAAAATPDVELSFATEKPFFPYREPAGERTSGSHESRSLRVFLLSNVRMEGRLGSASSPDSWPGNLDFARPLDEAEIESMVPSMLVLQRTAEPLWLTTYIDRSSPRPGTDEVYFTPAAQQTVVTPPPIIVRIPERVPVPVEPFVLLAGAGLFAGVRLARRRGQRAAAQPRWNEQPR